MNILETISNDTGLVYHKKATTLGGEYSGSCPWCGGDDRFSIHPGKNHFVCRKCKKAGDSISFMILFHGLTYREACKALGILPEIKPKEILRSGGDHPSLQWSPRATIYPPEEWQKKAEIVLFEAYKRLLSPAGKQHREWLNSRGISNSTIKAARMGWVSNAMGFDLESWGLTPNEDQNALNRQIWIPEGLIIPYFVNGRPVRLRVRQSKQDVKNRYILVTGSAMPYFDYPKHQDIALDPAKPVLITESELDGWLLQEKLGDIFHIYAIGNASARPDTETHQKIKNVPILLNLDDDEAGHAEQEWWHNQYDFVYTHYSEFGKDPGESFEVGVDIQAWGSDGLKLIPGNILSQTNKVVQLFNENVKSKSLQAIDKIYNSKPETPIKHKSEQPQELSPDPETEPEIPKKIERMPAQAGACIHGLLCQSFKDGQCLVSKQPVSSLIDSGIGCPEGKWYVYDHPSGAYSQIILGIGLKNRWA